MKKLNGYFLLMKPTIMMLVLLTGATSLVLEKSLLLRPLYFALVLLGLLLTGGSANAFNMYFERHIDAKMTRTRYRRPLPLGMVTPAEALVFATMAGIAGVVIFAIFFNIASALLALATILFYSFFYTLILKPSTPYNVVIGSAAGSMAPIIGWVAATGRIDIIPVILFSIVFFWSPPHFWALALFKQDDYKEVGLPMLPVVRGEGETRFQILVYSFWVVASSVLLLLAGAGPIYLVMAISSGGFLIYKSYRMHSIGGNPSVTMAANNQMALGFFKYSILYLFIVFLAAMVDSAFKSLLF